MYMIITIQ